MACRPACSGEPSGERPRLGLQQHGVARLLAAEIAVRAMPAGGHRVLLELQLQSHNQRIASPASAHRLLSYHCQCWPGREVARHSCAGLGGMSLEAAWQHC